MELECALIRHRIQTGLDRYDFIDYAVKGDSPFAPLVSNLMEHGANPHAQDKSQRTPQNMTKNPEIIQLLKVTPRQSLSSVASDLSSTALSHQEFKLHEIIV
jgi:hypothetical protein